MGVIKNESIATARYATIEGRIPISTTKTIIKAPAMVGSANSAIGKTAVSNIIIILSPTTIPPNATFLTDFKKSLLTTRNKVAAHQFAKAVHTHKICTAVTRIVRRRATQNKATFEERTKSGKEAYEFTHKRLFSVFGLCICIDCMAYWSN